jgi:hypothetical protein
MSEVLPAAVRGLGVQTIVPPVRYPVVPDLLVTIHHHYIIPISLFEFAPSRDAI